MFAHEARLLARQSGKQATVSLTNQMIKELKGYIAEEAKQGEFEIHVFLYEENLEKYPTMIVDRALSATIQYFAQMGYEVSMDDKKEDDYTLLSISWEEQ